MRTYRTIVLLLVAVIAAACGNPAPERGLRPPVQSQSSALLGHWVQARIGNCINDEAWLSFEAPDVLTVTSVDRNFCYAHSIAASKGTFIESPNGVVELAWTTPDGEAHQARTTFAIRDEAAVFAAAPIPESYVVGERGLTTSAFARVPGRNLFRREDHQSFEQDGKSYRLTLEAAVELDVDPSKVTLPAACTMKVALTADADWGNEPAEQGSETFELPCHVSEVEGRVLVTADGFDPASVHSEWSDYFTAQGAWERHSGFVANALYGLFRPLLEVDRADPDALIGRDGSGWYAEMKSAPPSSVE